jgi:hypothetical protein
MPATIHFGALASISAARCCQRGATLATDRAGNRKPASTQPFLAMFSVEISTRLPLAET